MSAPAEDAAPALLAALRVQLERHPYRTVGLAAAVGYLLGTRLGGPLVTLLSSRPGLSLALSVAPLLAPRSDP
jgi:hypothetical protein